MGYSMHLISAHLQLLGKRSMKTAVLHTRETQMAMECRMNLTNAPEQTQARRLTKLAAVPVSETLI